jgi:anti-anti-sigma regulatory factor
VAGYLDPRAVGRLRGVLRGAPVTVVDVSGLDGFSSAGLTALLALQAERGEDRLQVVGLEEATARLVGLDSLDPAGVDAARRGPDTVLDLSGANGEPSVSVSLLNAVAVLAPPHGLSAAGLGRAVRGAADAAAGRGCPVRTVVVDLLAAGTLSPAACWELADAAAELRRAGRNVLIVNAAPSVARLVENTGLPDQVYVRPATE